MLSAGTNLIGRDAKADILVDHTSVSRRHASILVNGDDVVLHDLESRNGTFVNGRRIDRPMELRDGDIVGLGRVTLTVERPPQAGTTSTDLDS